MKELNLESFSETVSEGVVLVDFWAPWCGPCRMLNPIIEQLSQDFEGKAIVAKANIEEFPELAQQFNIAAIPAMIIFKNGQEVDRLSGVNTTDVIKSKIEVQL